MKPIETKQTGSDFDKFDNSRKLAMKNLTSEQTTIKLLTSSWPEKVIQVFKV